MTSTMFSEPSDGHYGVAAKHVASLATRAKRSSQTATDGMMRTEAMTEFLAAIAALQLINIAAVADAPELIDCAKILLR
jgi:hypothetical protein